jgi:hypothetical protein
MSYFGAKINTSSHPAFQKISQNSHAFGQKNQSHVFRKIHHTLNDITDIANPFLATGSIIQPEFAPLAGVLRAGLGFANEFSRYESNRENRNNKINFVDSANHIIRKPQLER